MRLGHAAGAFEDAINVAALDQVGPKVRQEINDAATSLDPDLIDAPAWEALAGKLALVALTGQDPVEALRRAAESQELTTATDPAAVLHWRLGDDIPGVLPWLPEIPAALAEHRTWGPYLNAREDLVRQASIDVHAEAASLEPAKAPAWASALIDHPHVLAAVATWRAAHNTPEGYRSPVGPPHPSVSHRTYQATLERAVIDATVLTLDGSSDWKEFLRGYDERVLTDPYWPVLAERLSIAAAAGVDIRETLVTAAAKGPLPDEQAAAALWWRVNGMLVSSAGVDANHGTGASRLRPPWTDHLHELLGQDLATRVMSDAAWPVLVGAVHNASQDGPTPQALLSHAVSRIDLDRIDQPDGLPRSAVATVLTWRLHDLQDPGDAEAEPDVGLVAEDEQFLDNLAAEYHQSNSAAGIAPGVPPGVPLEEPADDRDLSIVDPEHAPPEDIAPVTTRERVLELNNQAMDLWASAYPGSGAAAYLAGRIGTDLMDDDRFPVGYAPAGWTTLVDQLRQTGASDQELVDSGLGKYTRRGNLIDVFRDRLIFGIQHDGDLVGFTGRASPDSDDATPKYINTPATAAFTKGNTLYGRDAGSDALADGATPVLVEGALDAIAITLAGDGQHVGCRANGDGADRSPGRSTRCLWPSSCGYRLRRAGRAAARKAFGLLADRGIDPQQLVASRWIGPRWHSTEWASSVRSVRHGRSSLHSSMTRQTRAWQGPLGAEPPSKTASGVRGQALD